MMNEFELILKKAEEGDVEAMIQVAHAYAKGEGIDKDPEKAYFWYLKASDKTDENVSFVRFIDLYNLGKAEGDCLMYCKRAADEGNALALFNLGWVHHTGLGKTLEKDPIEAARLFALSAAQGYAQAEYMLGVLYYEGKGVEQDYAKAVEWLLKAAENGSVGAQYNLGCMYHNGNAVVQDDVKALEWFHKAAEKGDARAQFTLAWMYDRGRGVERDADKAFEWCQKAADQGHAEAQYNLGMAFLHGNGVAKDIDRARFWLEKAAAQEYDLAKQALKAMDDGTESV